MMEKMEPGMERLNVQFMHGDDAEGNRMIRVDFGRMVNCLILPKEHAVHFALMMLQHAGADIKNLKNEPASEAPIDVTPDNGNPQS